MDKVINVIRFKRNANFEFESFNYDSQKDEVYIVEIEKGKVYRDLYEDDIKKTYNELFNKYNVTIEHEEYGEMSIEVNPDDIEILEVVNVKEKRINGYDYFIEYELSNGCFSLYNRNLGYSFQNFKQSVIDMISDNDDSFWENCDKYFWEG